MRTLGMVGLGLVVLGGYWWLGGTSPQEGIPRTEERKTDRLGQEQELGWVFGRLIGYPGADRPLTGTSFSRPSQPPTSFRP